MPDLKDIAVPESVTLEGLIELVVNRVKETNPDPVLYDLGCGTNPAKGFRGVDLYSAADVQHDLFNGDWSFTPDGSVDAFFSSHFVEHVPDLAAFMTKVYRKLKPEGLFLFVVPYGGSERAYQDPDHRQRIFRPTLYYFNRESRKKMGIEHVPHYAETDFDILEVWPAWNNYFAARAANWDEATREYHFKFVWNAVDDMTALMRKRKQ